MSSLQVATGYGSATGNPRNKTALKKGRGLMDWVRLGNTNTDLSGTGGNLKKISLEELSKHNTREDAWMAIRGKVFNVTPYFEYHPGGEDELMRGVGLDATSLFNEVHQWVNYESMLKKCYVGPLDSSSAIKAFTLPRLPPATKNNSLKPPSNNVFLKLPSFPQIDGVEYSKKPAIRYDWFQTRSSVNISIYTKWKAIRRRHIVACLVDKEIQIYVYVQKTIFRVHLQLLRGILKDFQIRLGESTGKIEIVLSKSEPDIHWLNIGTPLQDNGKIFDDINMEIDYFKFRTAKNTKITHDTFLLTIIPLDVMHFGVPLGYHVFLKVPGFDIIKPYTPTNVPSTPLVNANDGKELNFFIKSYPDGMLTPKLAELDREDILEVGIPKGKFGADELQRAIKTPSHLILLAAGTGITPVTSLILPALNNEVKTHLIFFNKTEADIPWKHEWESLENHHEGLFKVTQVLSQPPETWVGWKGRIRKQIVANILPICDGEKTPFVCLCGPKGFTDLAVDLLADAGQMKEDIHVFLG